MYSVLLIHLKYLANWNVPVGIEGYEIVGGKASEEAINETITVMPDKYPSRT